MSEHNVATSFATLKGVLLRSLGLLALLVLEYVVIALNFDGLMHRYPGPWEHLTDLVTFSVLGVGGVFVLFGRRVLKSLSATFATYPHMPPLLRPLSAHLAGYAALLVTVVLLSRGEWTRLGFSLGVLLLLLCGLVSLFALMLCLLPWPGYRRLAAELRMQLLYGLLAGALAFAGGFLASLAWESMAATTLILSAALLRALRVDVLVIPSELTLSAEGFSVYVAKECSGLEGIGLLLVFLSLYLIASRDRFRFPRALVLFPLGVTAMYLANLVRIAILVLVGARFSPAVALGGFHSKAGWVFFSAVSLSLVALASRFRPLLTEDAQADDAEGDGTLVNDTAVFLMPLLAMIASYLTTSLLLSSAFDPLYGLRVCSVVAMLLLYRRPLSTIPRHVSFYGPLAGVVAFGLWLGLMPAPSPESHAELAAGLAALPSWAVLPWLVVRVLGSVITVPIAEELAFRGFLLRRVAASDFAAVPFNHVTWVGLLLSSVAFGALHSAYVAGIVVGVVYGLTMWRRGSLADAVVAHATTNALLSGYVLLTQQYGYW